SPQTTRDEPCSMARREWPSSSLTTRSAFWACVTDRGSSSTRSNRAAPGCSLSRATPQSGWTSRPEKERECRDTARSYAGGVARRRATSRADYLGGDCMLLRIDCTQCSQTEKSLLLTLSSSPSLNRNWTGLRPALPHSPAYGAQNAWPWRFCEDFVE